jgi:flavin reductase (DIM6/NTAB) family NADH-FMN oxidoreductase RutF
VSDDVTILIDPADKAANYKLLIGSVVPRPVAWITSLGANGAVNAAPFSCYTFVCSTPPMLAINIGARDGGAGEKDTTENMRRSGEFVVNVVALPQLPAMHQSSADYPSDIGEAEALGLELAPSERIAVPGIAKSPVRMECVLDRILDLGDEGNHLVLGRVVAFHVRRDLYRDGRIDSFAMAPVARLGGPNYASLGEFITMPAAVPERTLR